MLRFNDYASESLVSTNQISIHLMLRFNDYASESLVSTNQISIHLMLRFNSRLVSFIRNLSDISIHLMLRFNSNDLNDWFDMHRFQYILCYGSTFKGIRYGCLFINFNTSYVTVQHGRDSQSRNVKYYFNTSYVTVQPQENFSTFRINTYFNTSYVTVQRWNRKSSRKQCTIFQYILCYGSTITAILSKMCSYNFNTSYVTVQLNPSWRIQIFYRYFNTSYVTVQHQQGRGKPVRQRISIHLMLRFNKNMGKNQRYLTYFNTSYVTVQRLF